VFFRGLTEKIQENAKNEGILKGLSMKKSCVFAAVFSFACGVFSVNAQDLIVLKDGNMIEAKVLEISLTEIRYKRFDNLDGPTVVIPAANVMSIRYENGKTEIINAAPSVVSKGKTYTIDVNKFHFSIAAEPSGFLTYGPFVLTEFTKNHVNVQIYVSLPSLGLLTKSDGFGIGFGGSLNYLWYTRLGAFYLGGLFDYTGYKIQIPGLISMPNGYYTDGQYDYESDKLWQSNYTLGLNLGFKFILSSGLYFTTGGSIGATMSDDILSHRFKIEFFARPNIAMGYIF